MPPFVPPPSRSPAQNFSPVTPAESLPVSGLNFPLARLTTARETSTISHEETSFLPAVFRDTPPCFLASRWARSSGFHGPTERVQHFAVGSIPGCGRCRLATWNSYLLFYSWGYAPNAWWRIRCVAVLDCSLWYMLDAPPLLSGLLFQKTRHCLAWWKGDVLSWPLFLAT